MRYSVGWSGQTGMKFRVNHVSGKTRDIHPQATLQYMPFLQHCTPLLFTLHDLCISILKADGMSAL